MTVRKALAVIWLTILACGAVYLSVEDHGAGYAILFTVGLGVGSFATFASIEALWPFPWRVSRS